MSIPSPEHPLPPKAVELADGRPVRPVWVNQLGGITCAIGEPEPSEYLKWSPHHHEIDLPGEAERLRWAGEHLPCPEVIGTGSDADGEWLHTQALPGASAITDDWSGRTTEVVPELGRALRHVHDSLPVDECPWTWSVPDRLATQEIEPSRIAGWPDPPGSFDPVVCTGDACAPNFLLCLAPTSAEPATGTDPAESLRWCGFVDLGDLGVADRWADLAVALWSLEFNFGVGWEEDFLAGYGIGLDPAKRDFYRGVHDAHPGAEERRREMKRAQTTSCSQRTGASSEA